jgi:exopolysaccharide production protein ExoQ
LGCAVTGFREELPSSATQPEFAETRCGSIWQDVSTWALLVPLLYSSGVVLNSSQDHAIGDLMSAGTTGPWAVADKSYRLIFALIVLWLLVSRWRAILAIGQRQLWLVLMVCLAFVSTVWSQDAGNTASGAAWFAIYTGFILWFASRFEWRDQMRLLMLTGTVGALLSLVAVVAIPSTGLDTMHGGAWQGVFYSKNHLARAMLFMLLPAFHLRTPKRASYILLRLGYIALLLVVIVMSQSKTAIILAGFYFVYWSSARIVTRFNALARIGLAALGILCLAVAAAFILPNLDAFLRIFGGDSSLTGRTTIWAALIMSAMKHLSLGYGYQAFWVSGSSEGTEAFTRVYSLMHFTMSYSHSGYLDVLLQLGVVGLSVIVLCLVRMMLRSYSLFQRAWSPEAEWATGVLLITILYNIDEVTFIQQWGLNWMIFVLASISLARLANQRNTKNHLTLAVAGEP